MPKRDKKRSSVDHMDNVMNAVREMLVAQKLDFEKQCTERETMDQKLREDLLLNAHKEAEEIIAAAENSTAELLKQKQQWETEQARVAETQSFTDGGVIKLNVGGTRFETSLTTLRRFPDSLIGAMFSGRHTTAKDSEGCYFLDQDGTHFRHILNFLRNPTKFTLADISERDKLELRAEAEYYGLVNEIFPAYVESCELRDSNGDKIRITQDENGLWYGEPLEKSSSKHSSNRHRYIGQRVLLHICKGCDCAYVGTDTTRWIDDFVDDRRIRRKQPECEGCETCG